MGAAWTVTRDDLADYLGIDWRDSPMVSNNLDAALAAGEAYLRGACGPLADYSDPRARAAGLAFAADFYEQRHYEADGVSAKAGGAVRRMVSSLCEQLRLEASARGGDA